MVASTKTVISPISKKSETPSMLLKFKTQR